MKAKHKLIITEFNTIGSPTSEEIRSSFETMFGLKWSGWTGRYFNSFDTTQNREIPRWLINNYKRQHGGQWPFHNAGVAFVNNSDQVVVVEEETHLKDAMPHIESSAFGEEKFGLPKRIKYSFWFDVMQPDISINKVIAEFKIATNEKGDAELRKYNIPSHFPAVTMHTGSDYQFYYFSGDFCDNPVKMITSYFKGIRIFKSFFYNDDPGERSSFFWNFYQPMLTTIVDDYYHQMKKH